MSPLKKNIKSYWSIYLSGFIILTMILCYFMIPDFQRFLQTFWEVIWSDDKERITKWFKNFGIWGPLLIISLMILQMFLIIFPTWLPMIVAVIGYGAFWGIVISITAVFLSSTIGYFLGEKLSNSVKENMVGGNAFDKLSNFMKKHGFGAVILFRISPFLSNDAISFVAGIIKMGYRKYILATMVGIVPLVCAIAYFGNDTSTLKSGLYWIGGFGILFYVVYLWMSYRKK